MSFSNIASQHRQREINEYQHKVQRNNRTPGDLLQFDSDVAQPKESPQRGNTDAAVQTALRKFQDLSRELAKETSLLATNPSEVKHMGSRFEDRKGQSRTLISNVQKALDSWQPDSSNPVYRFAKDKATDAFAEEKRLCMRRLEEFQAAIANAKDKEAARAAGGKPKPSYASGGMEMGDLIDLGQPSHSNGNSDGIDLIDLGEPAEDRNSAESRFMQAQIQRENTQRIEGIAKQAGEVKGLFRELANVVQDQNEMIETIADSAESVERNTRAANDELRKTKDRMGGNEQMCRWALLIALCFLVYVMYFRSNEPTLSLDKDRGQVVVRSVADRPLVALSNKVELTGHYSEVHDGRIDVGRGRDGKAVAENEHDASGAKRPAIPPGKSDVVYRDEERFHCHENKDPRANGKDGIGKRMKSYRCKPEI